MNAEPGDSGSGLALGWLTLSGFVRPLGILPSAFCIRSKMALESHWSGFGVALRTRESPMANGKAPRVLRRPLRSFNPGQIAGSAALRPQSQTSGATTPGVGRLAHFH
jgi:hypothetical protein